MTTTIHCQGVSATLLRSKRRRSLAIEVKRGEVTVRAPAHLPYRDIERFVAGKASWLQRILLQHEQLPQRPQRDCAEGCELFWLGEAYRLRCRGAARNAVFCDQGGLQLHLSNPEADASKRRAIVADWYRQQAKTYLAERIAFFAPQLQVAARGLKVRYYKTRWGSCNARGELQFNWLIMMAPPAVIDYVVVHELCHLRHFDHSPAFWRLVAGIMPDYQRYRQWFKNQHILYW